MVPEIVPVQESDKLPELDPFKSSQLEVIVPVVAAVCLANSIEG